MPDLNPNDADFYDLVIVGRGYSASTYLFTADLSWCNKILIIGGPDAWQHIVRGDGVVNHANYIYARDNPDQKITPEAKVKEGNKEKLKDENVAILQKSINWLNKTKDIVTDVKGVTKTITKTPAILADNIPRPTKSAFLKKGEAVSVYEITYDKWNELPGIDWSNVTVTKDQTVKTLKVVYCGGAGPQADFYNYDRKTQTLRYDTRTFMDLDSFMRSDPSKVKPAEEGTSAIALLGPNAGVDAAIVALNRKFKLYWLISGPQDSNPAWLSTKHYVIDGESGQKAINEANKSIVNYPKTNRPSFKFEDNLYQITFPHEKSKIEADVWRREDESQKFKSFEAQYVVYATGQDPGTQEVIEGTNNPWRIGPAKVLGPILANEKLTPIYDINQRFGNWYECALGLKDSDHSAYTGLEVMGASALALANFSRGSKVGHAYFSHTGVYTRALDSTVQPGTKINDALKAIQNSGWNENANTTRLYDHFDRQGEIPTVATAMGAIMPKLYSQTLIAADQLGVVKSQIEAITGFDLIAASTTTHEWTDNASSVLQATQQLKKAIESLPSKTTVDDLGPLKEAIENYKTARYAFGEVDNNVNEAAAEYIKLLPKDERDELRKEGFQANRFASEINSAVRKLSWQVNFISADTPHVGDDWRYLQTYNQQDILKNIPAVQRQLTNLQAIFQASTTGNIQSAINFNSMDRTQLAVLLAAQYPAIPATNWRPITAQILEGRKVSPWGYKPEQVTDIEAWLKDMNAGTKSVNEFPLTT